MTRFWTGNGLLLLTFGLTSGTAAWGQAPATPGNARGLYVNPYNNPYMNPLLNPIAASQPMDRNSALYYLLSAQAAKGGLGSGRMARTQAQATIGNKGAAGRPVAEMPRAAMIPGAGAARYFGRGPVKVQGSDSYFGRQNRYFGNNGR